MKVDRIAQFLRRLRAAKRRRIDLPMIWGAYRAVWGDESSGVEARAELRELLDHLCQAGACILPSERGAGWDRTSTVALPRWVTIPAAAPKTDDRQWRSFPWQPALAWVTELATLPADHEAFLMKLHRALVEGHLQERAPFKYRSLQLTGDEKRLEGLMATQLFGPNRLSLDVLNCDGVGLPLTYERVGAEPKMIIFENAGSFLVARRVLAQAARAPYGFVAYGGGTQILRSVEYLKEIHGLSSLEYVGDLDAKGIDIGATFAHRVREAVGLPVSPATAVHAAMLDAAAELGYADGWPTASRHRTDMVHEWLSPSCADAVERILLAGRRIPEEVVNDARLRDTWQAGCQM
jgi:hypothetical protein